MSRLFAAIKIHPANKLIYAMKDFQQELKYENIKWVDSSNIHITLKFFGETPPKQIPAIIDSLKEASDKSSSFKIDIKGCGTFGSPRFPRVIWFGLDKTIELQNLYDNINTIFSEKDYLSDKHGFSPHLTIGRVKHIKNLYSLDSLLSKYTEKILMTQNIIEFQLFESILRKEGAKHNIIETFFLS